MDYFKNPGSIDVPGFFINESSLKTVAFGLKPRKWLIFNSPALKGGVIDMRDNQGFSHIVKICGTFLDPIHKSIGKRNIL